MPQIHHRSGDMLLPCIPCLFRTRSKMDLGIHDQEHAGRYVRKQMMCTVCLLFCVNEMY
jgi:hypothetical protein